MFFQKSFRFAAAALLACAVAAPGCSSRQRPNRVAEKMVRGVMENDFTVIQETVDAASRNQVTGAMLAKVGVSLVTDGGVQGKLTELRAVTLSDDGKNAVVEVRGKLKVGLGNTSATVPVNFQLSLINKGGRWYVTSLDS